MFPNTDMVKSTRKPFFFSQIAILIVFTKQYLGTYFGTLGNNIILWGHDFFIRYLIIQPLGKIEPGLHAL